MGGLNGFVGVIGGYPKNLVEEEHIYDRVADDEDLPPIQPCPPPESPKEENKVGWACPLCTYINLPRRPGCKQCGSERPQDYIIPEGLPMDEEEMKIEEEARKNEQLFREVCIHSVYITKE